MDDLRDCLPYKNRRDCSPIIGGMESLVSLVFQCSVPLLRFLRSYGRPALNRNGDGATWSFVIFWCSLKFCRRSELVIFLMVVYVCELIIGLNISQLSRQLLHYVCPRQTCSFVLVCLFYFPRAPMHVKSDQICSFF